MRTMLSSARRVLATGVVVSAAVALVVVPATGASASVSYGKKSISKFGCIGKLDIDHRAKGKWYARGRFYTNPDYNTACRVKLQRKKGSGRWVTVSKVGSINNSHRKYRTGWHWDADPYKSRVCVEYFNQDKWYCSGSF